ncbi:MAG TPA: PaaI family thioesterase [Pseudonocardia sp.]|uniref:PaaI family thioesterase n=1 Tax=Pseudonocardia sp. TaxID=60912 RepID=UPI002C630756|nr:PaaI family thioesterase [Pseudonocardia sp.]HTF51518.1 PaaI family thioesterase [Pseudonocardia sp.]
MLREVHPQGRHHYPFFGGAQKDHPTKGSHVELTQDSIYKLAPFAATLGIEFPVLTASRVRAELANRHELSTLGGGLHGGAIMSLSDLAGAVCAGLNITGDAGWTTVESTTYFLRAVRGERAAAVATPVKVGRGLINVDIDVFDEADRHCARTSQILFVQSVP